MVGCAVAVDEDHVVAFAEPAVGVLQDAVGDADEMAAAGGFEEDVVAFAIQIFVAGVGDFLQGAAWRYWAWKRPRSAGSAETVV